MRGQRSVHQGLGHPRIAAALSVCAAAWHSAFCGWQLATRARFLPIAVRSPWQASDSNPQCWDAPRRRSPEGHCQLRAVVATHRIAKADITLAPQIVDVVNWAYRGKHAEGDQLAWTSERHLIDGIRTTEQDIRELLARAEACGEEQEVFLVARTKGQSIALQVDFDDSDETLQEVTLNHVGQQEVIGTVHVKKVDATAAEIGMFSVDPDLQGKGVGSELLRAAEDFAGGTMLVRNTVMWVISVRHDLLKWYERKGYRRTGETAPFPDESANVGTPRQQGLEFIRLEKDLLGLSEGKGNWI